MFLILSGTGRHVINNVCWYYSRKLTVISVRFSWDLNFLEQNFEKCLNTKFYENPSSKSSRVVASGQTDVTKLLVL